MMAFLFSFFLLAIPMRVVLAQDYDLLKQLPVCGQSCLKGQLDQAEAFGCTSTNALNCLCHTPAFQSAMRGCSTRDCVNNDTESDLVISNIRSFCSQLEVSTDTALPSKLNKPITMTRFRTITPVSFVFITSTTSHTTTAIEHPEPFKSVSTNSASVALSSVPSTSSTTSTSTASPSSPQLSTTNKMGIGLGVPIGIIFGFLVSGIIIYRYKKRHRVSTAGYQLATQEPTDALHHPEVNDDSSWQCHGRIHDQVEISRSIRAEGNRSLSLELEGSPASGELPGNIILTSMSPAAKSGKWEAEKL